MFISQVYMNNISFGQRYSFADLNRRYFEINGHTFKSDISTIITSHDNMLGEGKNKIVYSLPNIAEYVIALLKSQVKLTDCNIYSFEQVKNLLPKFNFGQCIADNNNGLKILTRVNGKPHLLEDYVKRINSYTVNGDITQGDALRVLEKLKKLEGFPQESFDILIQKIIYLNRKNVRIDTINPNNILIEYNTKEINPIDVEFNFHTQNIKPPYNGYNDIIYMLLNPLLHNIVLEKLPLTKKMEFIKVTKNLVNKIKHSADNIGLSSSVSTSRQVYREHDDFFKNHNINVNILDSFEKFNKIYLQ